MPRTGESSGAKEEMAHRIQPLRMSHTLRSGILNRSPAIMRPPRRAGGEAEDQRRRDREEAVEKRRRDRVRVRRTERDEGAGQPELDKAEPSRSQRQRAENSDEGPGGERLDERDLVGRDA